MLRPNSPVRALSLLGKRRGGDSVAGMSPDTSVFSCEVEFASRNWACQFNKLIGTAAPRYCDRCHAMQPFGGEGATPLAAGLPPPKIRRDSPPLSGVLFSSSLTPQATHPL